METTLDQVVQEELVEKMTFTWRSEWQKGPRYTKIRKNALGTENS